VLSVIYALRYCTWHLLERPFTYFAICIMVLESAQEPVKRGRGRPRKNPIETPASSVQPTKHVAHTPVASHKRPTRVLDTMTREEELAAFERHSNKS
jgi:hypothetical protein